MNYTIMGALPSVQEICDGESPGLTLGLAVALTLSEFLGLTDRVRGNGLLHTIVHAVNSALSVRAEQPVPQDAPVEPMSPRLGIARPRETSGDTIEKTTETVTRSHVRTSSLHGVPKSKRSEGETQDHSDF